MELIENIGHYLNSFASGKTKEISNIIKKLNDSFVKELNINESQFNIIKNVFHDIISKEFNDKLYNLKIRSYVMSALNSLSCCILIIFMDFY